MNTAYVLSALKEENVTGIMYDVAEILSNNPNSTAGEIHAKYKKKYPKTTRSRNEIAKRVSDLYSLGVIKPNGKVICPTSGRVVNTWNFTGKTPVKTNVVKTKDIQEPSSLSIDQHMTDFVRNESAVMRAMTTMESIKLRSSLLKKLPFVGKYYQRIENDAQTAINYLVKGS